MATSREVDDEVASAHRRRRRPSRSGSSIGRRSRRDTIAAEVGHGGEQLAGCTRRCGRVEDLIGGPRLDDAAPSASRAPGRTRSATTPMSWVISRIPASMRSRRSRISLRISACTVTSSAVVGSSATSSGGSQRQRLGDHRPLPLAARQLVRVRVDAPLGIGDLDQLEQLDRPLAGRLRRHRLVAAQHLGDLEPDRVHRVERRHRLLEDHRHVAAADLAQGAVVEADDLAAADLDRAARRDAFSGSRPIIANAIVDLPEPDSPTIASTSPATRSNSAPIDGRVPRAVDPEVDVEVADLERRLGVGPDVSRGAASRACVLASTARAARALLARWRRAARCSGRGSAAG